MFRPLRSPLLALLFSPVLSFAQGSISNVEVHWMLPEGEDTTGLSEDDMMYVLKDYHVSFNASSAVSNVMVKMGMGPGSDDFLGKAFDLSQNTAFEDLTSVTVLGDSVNIGLGHFNGLRGFHLQLLPLDENGGVIEVLHASYP